MDFPFEGFIAIVQSDLNMDYSEVIAKVKNSIAVVIDVDPINPSLSGKGSGFIFQKRGILVTCNHVVLSESIKLKFPDNKPDEYVDAAVVLRDVEHDLALLKFDDEKREPLKIGDVNVIKEGMPVIFSGYPFSLTDLTTHHGILSAIITDPSGIINYLIDGSVNSGNSGCPLMTESGEVIGVVNATRREYVEVLNKVENMRQGAISLHSLDLVKIFKALSGNLQLGIGYAIPCSYIPEHHELDIEDNNTDKNNNELHI